MCSHGVPQRKASKLLKVSRSVLRYQQAPRKPSDLLEKLKAIALEYPQYGYRKAHACLRRQGYNVNIKTVHRLWKQNQLQQKIKKTYRKVRSGDSLSHKATQANEVWALDFVFDQTVQGQTLKFLTVTDEHSKMLICTQVNTRFRARDVIQALDQAFMEHGTPQKIRSDNGSEFVARDLAVFLGLRGIQSIKSAPGKPWQNGFAESLNSRFRQEFLNQHSFRTLKEAQVLSESYRQHFNTKRLHASLDYLTPCEFIEQQKSVESA